MLLVMSESLNSSERRYTEIKVVKIFSSIDTSGWVRELLVIGDGHTFQNIGVRRDVKSY